MPFPSPSVWSISWVHSCSSIDNALSSSALSLSVACKLRFQFHLSDNTKHGGYQLGLVGLGQYYSTKKKESGWVCGRNSLYNPKLSWKHGPNLMFLHSVRTTQMSTMASTSISVCTFLFALKIQIKPKVFTLALLKCYMFYYFILFYFVFKTVLSKAGEKEFCINTKKRLVILHFKNKLSSDNLFPMYHS